MFLWRIEVLRQICLNNNNVVIHNVGLAMGTPSCSILSEILIQHIEHTHLPQLTHKHEFINYFQYVGDRLLIYDSSHTDIHTILEDFNSIHPNLQFTEEVEQSNLLNYLDITIHKAPPNIKISTYRNPTFTDTLIPYNSNHPIQYKYSAIRFLYNRLNSYHLREEEYQQEENIIQNILHNNSYQLTPYKQYASKQHQSQQPQENKRKWTTFTYTG